MAPRAYWKGHLRLSLVSISVEMYNAVETKNEISFRQKLSNTDPRQKVKNWKEKELHEPARQICTLLEDGPLHIDQISEKLNRGGNEVLVDLLELEFSDCVSQKAGKVFELK